MNTKIRHFASAARSNWGETREGLDALHHVSLGVVIDTWIEMQHRPEGGPEDTRAAISGQLLKVLEDRVDDDTNLCELAVTVGEYVREILEWLQTFRDYTRVAAERDFILAAFRGFLGLPPWHQRVRALLSTLVLTQNELAERAGVSIETVNRWARGTRTPTGLSIVRLEELEREAGITYERSP